jgi:hypothetical protein
MDCSLNKRGYINPQGGTGTAKPFFIYLWIIAVYGYPFQPAGPITYTLFLLLIVPEAPAWQIIGGLLPEHVIAGIVAGVNFQVKQLHKDTTRPEPDVEDNIETFFAQHGRSLSGDRYNKLDFHQLQHSCNPISCFPVFRKCTWSQRPAW